MVFLEENINYVLGIILVVSAFMGFEEFFVRRMNPSGRQPFIKGMQRKSSWALGERAVNALQWSWGDLLVTYEPMSRNIYIYIYLNIDF